MEGPGPCGAQGCAVPTQLQNTHLVCFAALSGPLCTHSHTSWLLLYGCAAAAGGASQEEGCIGSMGSLHDWAGF